MESVLITVHYLICFFLIVVILLQAGKGANVGAVFGGASQTMFGSRGPATFLNKITVFVATGFLVTSISLAHLAKQRSGTSVIDKAPISQTAKPAAETKAEDQAKAAEKADSEAATATEEAAKSDENAKK